MITLHFDGSCLPGVHGKGGYVIKTETETFVGSSPALEGYPTCNAAEYAGLWAGLEKILERYGPQQVQVFGDSELVIKQMSGKWRVKNREKPYVPYWERACSVANRHLSLAYQWIPRELNSEADRASRS